MRTIFQEVYFDLCDVAATGKLPEEFNSWKEFFSEQRDKLASIEVNLFPEVAE